MLSLLVTQTSKIGALIDGGAPIDRGGGLLRLRAVIWLALTTVICYTIRLVATPFAYLIYKGKV